MKKHSAQPRPVVTFYYRSLKDKRNDWIKQSHSCSLENAICAATKKVYNGVAKAEIYGPTGKLWGRVYYAGIKSDRIVIKL